MSRKQIDEAIDKGYELTVVRRHASKDIHAYVSLGHMSTSHNFVGRTVEHALDGLDAYLTQVWEPKPDPTTPSTNDG